MPEFDNAVPRTPAPFERPGEDVLSQLRSQGLTPDDERFLGQNPRALRTLVQIIKDAQVRDGPEAGYLRRIARERLDAVHPKDIYDAARKFSRADPPKVATELQGGIPNSALAARLNGNSDHPLIRAQRRAYQLGRDGQPWEESVVHEWQLAPTRKDERGDTSSPTRKSMEKMAEAANVESEKSRTIRLKMRLEGARFMLREIAQKTWANEVRQELDDLSAQSAAYFDKVEELQTNMATSDIASQVESLSSEIFRVELRVARLIEDEE